MQIKNYLPNNLAYNIENYQSNTQNKLKFTILSTKNHKNIVIDISKTNPSTNPISLTNSQQFLQNQHNLSKQNKKQILNNYQIISCDQANSIIKKYFIVNLIIQGYKPISTNFIAYKFTHKQKSQIYPKQNFHSILHILIEQFNQIQKLCQNKYQKSLQDKKKTQLTSSLIPFLQFEITVLTTPNTELRMISELPTYRVSYPFIFESQQNILQQQISTKITQFINEKLLTNSFQKTNNLIPFLSSPRANPNKIFNPHAYIKTQKKDKFQIILTKGIYQYYHYGDQDFRDNGWGCAYRSLQTIISWLNIQGFTKSLTIPTIPQIQEKLDKIDRSRKLKNTQTWIGATEISWLIPTLTTPQLNCKILHISDGKQIIENLQQLKTHFLNSGCPIMYGGGQYAYSIIGLHYNWKLAQCQFLILDPHYTGQDDYGKIIEKKGISWRKPDEMFKKGIFYNFCMVQVK